MIFIHTKKIQFIIILLLLLIILIPTYLLYLNYSKPNKVVVGNIQNLVISSQTFSSKQFSSSINLAEQISSSSTKQASSQNILSIPIEKPVLDNRNNEDKIFISKSELDSNNSTKSCYISYQKKVYDITTFLSMHPGGEKKITRYCGKIVDDLSEIHGGGNFDSKKIQEILSPKYIGDLDI